MPFNFRRVYWLAAMAISAAVMLVAQTRLPFDFPKDVPIYPGAAVKQAGSNPGVKLMVILESRDPKDKVLAFYRTKLPQNGWKLEKPFSGSPDALQGTKGTRGISIAVLKQQGTLIQIGLM
jgi:hypothetical protein